MKTLLGLTLLLSATAFGAELKISGMTLVPQMDRSFDLKTQYEEKIVLDCQSFIQGIRVGEKGEAKVFMMGAWECEELASHIHSSVEKGQSHCVQVEKDVGPDYVCP